MKITVNWQINMVGIDCQESQVVMREKEELHSRPVSDSVLKLNATTQSATNCRSGIHWISRPDLRLVGDFVLWGCCGYGGVEKAQDTLCS